MTGPGMVQWWQHSVTSASLSNSTPLNATHIGLAHASNLSMQNHSVGIRMLSLSVIILELPAACSIGLNVCHTLCCASLYQACGHADGTC